ncbi:MFS transporter [Dongia mobilis]|uniref:MFS transporter n=1 Tax=Dongia sp. TaxID=1977262 RepID=UPI0026EAA966
MSRTDSLRLGLALCAALLANMAGFSVFAALLPTLQAAWHLSNTEAGIIEGAFLLGYLGSVPFLVAMTDRRDARAIYLVSTLLAVTGNLGTAILGDGIWTGVVTRLIAGMGLAGTFMPGLKLLTERLSGIGGNRAIAFYMATFSLGASLSTILAGMVGHRFGWQAPFFAAAALGLLAVPLVLVSTRAQAKPAGAHQPLWRRLGIAWRNRTARGYSLAYGLHMWELYGFRSWLIAFLVMATTGSLTASADTSLTNWGGLVLVLGLPASIVGNEIALRIGRHRWLGIIMPASAALSLVIGWSVDWPLAAVLALLALYTVTVSADSATLTAGAVESAPAELKGATMALHTLIGFTGASLGPLAAGGLLDLFGADTRLGWIVAFAAMGLVAVFGPSLIRRPS